MFPYLMVDTYIGLLSGLSCVILRKLFGCNVFVKIAGGGGMGLKRERKIKK